MTELRKEFKKDHPETIGETDRAFHDGNYIEWLEKELTEARTELKNNVGLGDLSVSNSFDIHKCINDIEDVIKNKLSGWMFIKGTIRYEIKKAIDKMLYSR